MLSQPFTKVCKSLLPSSLLLAAAVAPALAAPLHVSDAETLLSDLSVSKQNVYGSDPSYIHWNGTSSQARTVCGTFVTNLLLHTYNLTTSTFTQWMGTTSPYAETYYAAIVAQNRFTEINNISLMQPGDLIAIKYNDSSVTGHMMMVDSVAKAESPMSPIVSGTTQYAVTVIDSSSSYHGPGDTRVTDPSSTHNGIGRGDIRVYVNASLRPVGYSWSNTSGSPYYDMSQRPLAIGRINLSALGASSDSQGDTGGAAESQGGQDAQAGQEMPAQKSAEQQTSAADSMISDQAGGCSISASDPIEVASPGVLGLLLLIAGLLGLRVFGHIARS